MPATVTPTLLVTSTSKEVTVAPVLFVTTVPWSTNLSATFDTSRNVATTETILADTLRETTDGSTTILFDADTARNVYNQYTYTFDTAREVKVYTYLFGSTLRNVINDSKRQKSLGSNVLTLAPKTKIDSVSNVDSIVNFDFNGGINTSGTYHIPASHRIYNENNNSVCVDVGIDAEVFNINQWIDLAANFDSIKDFDCENISSFVSVTPYMRTSNDGTTYGNWQNIVSGAQYRAKYFDFKIELSTTDSNTTVLVNNFKYTVRL